jgi:hypothetical protein
MYNPWIDEKYHQDLIRHKVRHAAILNELAAVTNGEVSASPKPVLSPSAVA